LTGCSGGARGSRWPRAGVWQPRVVNLYMDNAVTVLRRRQDGWNVQRMTHAMGRPLMEPLIWNATSGKPFGRSRLKRSIRTLIDDYIRTVANAPIAKKLINLPVRLDVNRIPNELPQPSRTKSLSLTVYRSQFL